MRSSGMHWAKDTFTVSGTTRDSGLREKFDVRTKVAVNRYHVTGTDVVQTGHTRASRRLRGVWCARRVQNDEKVLQKFGRLRRIQGRMASARMLLAGYMHYGLIVAKGLFR